MDPTANLNGGVLTGTGTVAANVNNAVTVNPGSPNGALAVTGNFSQSAADTLSPELGDVPSLVPQPGFDQLNISGSATLGGTLTFASPWRPTLQDDLVNQAFQESAAWEVPPDNGLVDESRQREAAVDLLHETVDGGWPTIESYPSSS